MLLQDKVVVITGASQGIGKGIALGCAQAGANIVVHALGDERTTKDANDTVGEIEKLGRKGVVVTGDIRKPETSDKIVAEAVKAFGRIDCLVSNAGICPFYSFLDIPHDVWELTRSVNLDGAFFVVQAVAKQMKNQTPQGGSIVAVSSISALVGGGEQAHYTPTKAGVKSLMESCAISLAPFGIRCNSVLPGTVATAINEEDLAQPEKREYMNKRIPLGRLGKPEDLAGPTVFFLSDMASYVTGAHLLVDGGLFVNLQ
ncbi:short-chain dehydrogenase/reductase sdr [Meredithblackwellia eburnea MCA 4105]